MEEFDICIVGGGILGCAVAQQLSHYELRILLLEKNDDVATGITRGNTSIIHGGFDDKFGSVKARYSPLGAAKVEALDRYLHFGFHKCGSLVVSRQKGAQPQLEQLLANGQRNAVRGLAIWGKEALQEREPNISPEAQAALYSPESGVVIGPEFCIALAENAVANGVCLQLGEHLQAIHQQGPYPSPYILETLKAGQSQQYKAHYIVNAAGWGCKEVSQMLGHLDYELEAVKGQYLVLDRDAGAMVRHVLFPLPDPIKGKGVVVSPSYHGNLLLGPDAQAVSNPADHSTQLENLKTVFSQALSLVPGIPAAKVIRSYAGVRPRLQGLSEQINKAQTQAQAQDKAQAQSGDFYIRHGQSYSELIAIASPGLSSALPIAESLAAHITQQLQPEGKPVQRKANFHWERKAYIPSQRDKIFFRGTELQERTAKELQDPECLICRCEQVSSKVIQEALHLRSEPFVSICKNIDFLKWRTRATMGYCQGQYCKPRLKKLLALLADLESTEIAEYSGLAPERVPIGPLRKALAGQTEN